MKIKLLLAVGMVLILIIAGLAGCSAQGVNAGDGQPITVNVGNQQTGIWVNGEGKVTVTPDVASVSLGVSAQAASVVEATSQAAAAMKQVIDSLKANGVADKDIQTQYYSIQQVTRWDDKNQQEIVTGYRVSNTVTAKIRTMDKVGAVIDAVAAAGGDLTRINGISFSVDKPEQYYAQARELALTDAKAKAEQMAKLTGVTLGKVTYVTESSYTPYQGYPVMYKDSAASGASTTPITPGETQITMNVQVNYTIQ
jgi:uncharacterized protein YggE